MGNKSKQSSARYPVEASHARKPCAAYREIRRGEGATDPRHPPQTPSRRPLGFRADLQQPGRRNPPPRKYLECQGKENPGFPSQDPRGPFPRWKNSKSRFTQRKQNPLSFLSPFHPVMQEDRAHLRHPNSWGLYGPGCSGTNGHEAPAPPNLRINTHLSLTKIMPGPREMPPVDP
mgnify:CR=1 FL=1